MECNQISILQRPFYVTDLVWIFHCIVFHSDHQRLPITFEINIVMLKILTDIFAKSRSCVSFGCKHQKIRSYLFMITRGHDYSFSLNKTTATKIMQKLHRRRSVTRKQERSY